MSNVIIAKSNITGIVSISDQVSDLENTNLFLPSVYEGSAFSLKLRLQYFDESNVEANVTNSNCLSDLSNVGVLISKESGNTYNISGTYGGVITGAIYTFVMRDGTTKQLPIDTSEDYRAVIGFRLPTLLSKTLNVNFQVAVDGGIETGANMLQYVHFSYSSAISEFQNVVKSRP